MDLATIETWDLGYRGDTARHRTADGCELYYELEGEGPCVTFVSTIYVVSTAWRNFTRRVVTENRILTYDLRNQGASSGEPKGFDQHVDDLVSLLDHLGIERTHLVGSSISTLICRDFAVRHPDRVSGLILVGPPISPWGSKRRTRITRSWLAALESGGPRALFDAIYPLVFGDRTQAIGGTATYLALRERFLATNSTAQLRANLSDALDPSEDVAMLTRVAAPTLLLGGDDDFCISPSGLRLLAETMPDATAEIFDECGHLPFFEHTDRFEESLRDFVRGVEARRTRQ
ncbi:alpha/beta hydrolase [Nocardia sp. 2]|uniref:Alpha/beta hydrolase n=1 Tax=Nocardia acididurans TaxID=2802282 RepID=A0ABS1MGH9_9NOCA|nr:alpha/beta hydrolase [Nocardia acididurans]MBL1078323.1 alpha/beta hydrolase [Nocardia acididurans]